MSHSNQSIICCNNSSIVQLHNRLTNPRTHTHTHYTPLVTDSHSAPTVTCSSYTPVTT
ncbi:hypothetical protein Smp_185430 [Schistosoma mansoni]|uniref:hypothetical protein n=1 Tax=Schistosoma mansoni TaxID=6183 RepID=UPI00022C86A6|nr:hypothetical protein Smp_185430 [Schistosoma mansoni]|eukprot:XP_018644071.1 hypothetical protein Smp_185430 [Schistosoma mansoni]